MTHKQFAELVEWCQAAGSKTLVNKAKQYALDDDRLKQFKVIADLTGVSPLMVALILRLKHTTAIIDMAKSGAKATPEWWEKLGDEINYNILMYGLVIDANK